MAGTRRWQQYGPPKRLATYDPHPHQVVFHQSTKKYRALVSGVGAGKTRMGVEEVLKWSQLFPGCLGVIGRLTAKSLRETTQRRFFEVCPTELIADYNKSEEHLWLKTNEVDEKGRPVYSEILFFHLDDPGPLGSLDISWFWIDEAHEPDGPEVPEATFQMLTARLRHPVGPHRGFVTSNSGGKDWVWDRFFNEKKRKTFTDYQGWTAPTEANAKYLPVGYVDELRKDNPEVWVKRFLEASFDAFEGQIFTDFDEDVHTYSSGDVEISNAWSQGAGFDFGIGAPTAIIYGAIDRDDNVYMYDEDYQADADIELMSRRIRNKGFDMVSADPSVVNRGPNKKSPKELYQEHNVTLIPASNDEDYFIPLFRKLLRDRNKDGTPKIRICKKCVNLINQIKQAAWDPLTLSGTTHEKIKKMENHALDAFKYFLNTYGLNPGVLNPVNPKSKSFKRDPEWEHESFEEDEDYDDDNYIHKSLRRDAV